MANNTRKMSLEMLHPRSLGYLSDQLQSLVRGRLWLQVLIGMILGIGVGILIGPSVNWVKPETAATVSDWLAFPGKLFLALIQMIVIPLVFASIIRGLAATEDLEQLRKMGLRVALYFMATTALAVLIGISVATLVKPGAFIDASGLHTSLGALPDTSVSMAPGTVKLGELPQKFIGLLPSNPLSSMVESNMLEVVIFSMVVGVALVMMSPQQSRPLLDLMGSLQEVCMTVVRWAMWLAPYAVFGLIAQLTAKLGLDALLGMAVYVGTVLVSLLLMLFAYLIIIYLAAAQRPLSFMAAIRD
ncbi:MAG: cation:dicarboxylase symporter family transporter, partial [Anaerolineales bacterium]